VRDRIGHIFLTGRTVVRQLLIRFPVAAKDIKPTQRVIVIRVSPETANLMITPTNINANIGVINRFHYFYPRSKLCFKHLRRGSPAGNQVARTQKKVNILVNNLRGKLAQDNRINPIDIAPAVTGYHESPR